MGSVINKGSWDVFMVFDRSICYIPGKTIIEEKNLRCTGDVIISDRSEVSRGVITEGRIFIGEFTTLKGDIISIGDIRIDRGTRIRGNITGDSNVYLGERSKIKGELNVGRDLDIGEDVEIDPSTIESKGIVNIRNPISVIVYLFLYLLQLLKSDESEEVDRFFDELEEQDQEKFLISANFTYLPKGSRIDSEGIQIPGNIRVGPKSQIVANIESSGKVDIENEVQLFGDIRCDGDVFVGENVVINGSILSKKEVTIHHAARIGGDVRGDIINITHDTITDGTLKAENGVRMLSEEKHTVEDKIERFEKGIDTLEGIMDEEIN